MRFIVGGVMVMAGIDIEPGIDCICAYFDLQLWFFVVFSRDVRRRAISSPLDLALSLVRFIES